MENHHYLIWEINSHSIQAIVVLRQSEHMLNDWAFLPLVCRLKKLVRGLIPLDVGTSLKSQFQSSEHLICSVTFQNVFGATILNHTELSRSYQNVDVRCFVTSTDDAEVQHTERCIKDISLVCSNEDNPQFTDPVRIIATTNFQLNFL